MMESNLAYQEAWREEIIGGEAVMMAPPRLDHIFISGNVYSVFANYLRGKRCTPLPDGAMVYLEKGEAYIPDMMVVCDPDKLQKDGVHGAPDLVVEVLSPSTSRNDKGPKKDVYEKHGVREYWIISPGDRAIEQYILTDGRFVLRDVYHKYSAWELEYMKPEEREAIVTEFRCSLFDGLTIRVDDVFDRVAAD